MNDENSLSVTLKLTETLLMLPGLSLSHRAEEDLDRRVLGRPHLYPGHRTCVRLRLLNSQSECWAASARPGFRNPFSCKYSELTGRQEVHFLFLFFFSTF